MTVNVAVVGTGGIANGIHLPGLLLCPDTKIAALCDVNPESLKRTAEKYGVEQTYSDYKELMANPDIDAVIIATSNNTHKPIALAAAAAGKHILVEKPLAMSYADAREMWQAAEKANVRNQVAFNYRFIPAMRYMKHLVDSGIIGTPYHFRAQRFQDWGLRALGWRQVKALAATGELGDMASHRIDYARYLLGPIVRVSGLLKQYITERTNRNTGETQISDVDDWSGFIGEFANGATCMIESTKLATGHGGGTKSHDFVEINGSDASIIYHLNTPTVLEIGKPLGGFETVQVPREFLTVPGTSRNPDEGEPATASRYDQEFEFIDAIRNGRPASPSFFDGMRTQAVMDAIVQSAKERRWVDVPDVDEELSK